MKYFLDTSALVKIYYEEEGSRQVECIVEKADNEIYVSSLSRVEFVSVLNRKFRKKE